MYLHLDNKCATLIFDRTLDRINGAFKALDSRILRSIYSSITSQSKESKPTLSVALVLSTYNGGATSFALIGTASLLSFSPARRAFLMASIPAGV
jgi:hypothetical protein